MVWLKKNFCALYYFCCLGVLMVQDFTLHMHTLGFDGRDTAAQMVAHARKLGFKTVGISNHFIVHPDIRRSKLYGIALARGYGNIYSCSFDEALEKFKPHYEELDQLQSDNPDIRILRGMEVDFFNTPQWRDGFTQACEILKPDYKIGAAHFVEYNDFICNVHDMASVDKSTCDEMLAVYWENMRNLADSKLFNWIAHLDLPRKRNLGTRAKWHAYQEEVVATAANSHTPIEINTSGYHIDLKEPYPCNNIQKMLAMYHVPVLLSDDAHNFAQIESNFALAKIQALENGIKNFASLQKLLDFSGKRR